MRVVYDSDFWHAERDERSQVFQAFPDVHRDCRGCFFEAWKFIDEDSVDMDVYGQTCWAFRENWVRQMNTSCSGPLVVRGCHAQRGSSCQAKLVSAMNHGIFDVITDARPMSGTFMKTKVYYLNPDVQNRLFVPRGFLHAFVTGECGHESQYVFNYMCDNWYDRSSEITVCPKNIVFPAFAEYCSTYGVEDFLNGNEDAVSLSDKDMKGMDPNEFFSRVSKEYEMNRASGGLWYS